MSQNSIKWNFPEEKIFEIIHLDLIDILGTKEDKTCHLKKLVPLLNSKSKVNRINDDRKYNLFSKYLKIEHNGILNFIEDYNFYEIIRRENKIFVKLHEELVNKENFNSGKRITKDSEWILVDDSDSD
jgi:hypothetical protein